MPSFLNKVFGYKKHDDDKDLPRPSRDDTVTLLDGKYEAISPVVSPSAATFAEAQKEQERFSLFKPKRGVSHKPAPKSPVLAPHLTLHLPGPKENHDSRALDVVFEADPDLQSLGDATIAATRLKPLEALILIRACAHALTERGLETLGIMHPHWFSASPDVQRKLISLFIRSLVPQSRTTTLSPAPTASSSAFENELRYARSPHDVAAVLRWGLRHLTLENACFGKENDHAEWAWYNTFFQAERDASYPPKAFSELLLPQLPASHVELLTAVLNLISSLASRAETNGISGSKLSKFLGIWLLVAIQAGESDDWNRFYARWERAGRILEHLFLARLREESVALRLPTRLQELVMYYPYNKSSPATEDDLLSRPRFSTRQYDALCVRVETLLIHDAGQPKQHPIQLLLDAFQLPIENLSGEEHVGLWNTLKTAASEESDPSCSQGPQFARIFVDETIQLLSLIPAHNNASSPTLLTPITKVVSRERSSSLSKTLERVLSNANVGSTPASPTSPTSPVITDWAQFSLSGFGDAPSPQPLVALLSQDNDVEVTQPLKQGLRQGKSRTRRRSEERKPLDVVPSTEHEPDLSIVETKLASVHMVQIDEAFVDFWSDAIVDPISANWPTFILCVLKDIPGVDQSIRWLVIEQAYGYQQPPRPRDPSPDGRRGRSPRPSFKSDSGFRINSMFSSARKRFSVFSKSATDLDPKKSGAKIPTTGELGQVLVEEEPSFLSALPTKADHHIGGDVGATVSSGATADIADQLKVNEFTAPIFSIPSVQLSAVKESGSVHDTAEVPSVEPTPQAEDKDNGISADLGTAAGPRPNIVATAKDTPKSRTSDLGSRTSVDNLVQDEQMQAESRVEPSGELSDENEVDVTKDSRKDLETVAIESIPVVVEKTISESAVIAIAHDDPSRAAAEEPHVSGQPSRNVPANAATSTAESVDQHEIEKFSPLPVANGQDMVTDTALRPQPEPDCITVVTDGDKAQEVAEVVDIPTPIPEHTALVEDTPDQEVPVDVHGRAASQVPAVEPEAFADVVTQPIAGFQVAEESFVTDPIEVPVVEIVPVIDPGAQADPIGAEHAADQVSEPPTQEAQSSVQYPIIQAAEALQVDVSAGNVSATWESVEVALSEVEVQVKPENVDNETLVVETGDAAAPTPALENTALIDETPVPEDATEDDPVEEPPTIVEAVKDEAVLSVDQAVSEELLAQVHAESSSSTESFPPDTALSTVDEIPAVKAVDQPTHESTSITDTLEIAVEASGPVESAASDLTPAEDNKGAVDEAHAIVEDGVASASEPVTNAPTVNSIELDVRTPTVGPAELSSAFVAQSAGEAVCLAVETADEVPEAVVEPAPVAPQVGLPVEVAETIVVEPELTQDDSPAPVDDVVVCAEADVTTTPPPIVGSDETTRVTESQEADEVPVELSVTCEDDLSAPEPSEETPAAEP